MIKEIDKSELLKSFKGALIDVEFGDHFNKKSSRHNKILSHRVDKYIASGAAICLATVSVA